MVMRVGPYRRLNTKELMLLNSGAWEFHLLDSPWTASRVNQSILKEINPEHSLEEPILKLKLQYFGHLMQRADSLEKTLLLGKIEGRRRRGQLRIRWLDRITDWMDMNLGNLQEIVEDKTLECWLSWGCKELDTTWQLNNNKNYPQRFSTKQTALLLIVGTFQKTTNPSIGIISSLHPKTLYIYLKRGALSCIAPVPFETEECQRKRGLETKQDPEGPSCAQSPSMSPLSCRKQRF